MGSDRVFIHFTDTHITTAEQRVFPQLPLDTFPKMQAAIDSVGAMDINPAFFIISGDLTHEGEEATYERFKAFVDEIEHKFKVPVLCALGNHDHRVPFRKVMLGQADSDENTPYYYSRMIGDLRVIVLDTKVPGKEEGALDIEQLTWLANELAKPAADGNLLVLHHPPLTIPLPLLKNHGLTNAHALAEVIKDQPIIGILCGHIHFHSVGLFERFTCAAGAGVSFTLDPAGTKGMRLMDGSGFNLVAIQDGTFIVNPIVMPGEQKVLFYYQPEQHADLRAQAEQQ